MRRKLAVTSVVVIPLLALMMVTATSCTAHGQPDRSSNAPGATEEQFEQWMTEYSNWGRWGDDDQMGAANLLTPAKRLQAIGLVETGESVSLGHDVVDEGGSDPNRPFGLNMIISFVTPIVGVLYSFSVFERMRALEAESATLAAAQERMGELVSGSGGALVDVRAWLNEVVPSLRDALDVSEVSVWEWESGGELKTLTGGGAQPPPGRRGGARRTRVSPDGPGRRRDGLRALRA